MFADFSDQSFHCGRFKQRCQRHIYSEGVPKTGDDLCSQQRVATDFEEIILHAHLLQFQHLAPYSAHEFLFRRARSPVPYSRPPSAPPHPSCTNFSAVNPARLRYPRPTPAPPTYNSPITPIAANCPFPSTTYNCRFLKGLPSSSYWLS